MSIRPVASDLGDLTPVTLPARPRALLEPFTGQERDAALLMNPGLRNVIGADDRKRIPGSQSSAYPLQTLLHLLIQFAGPEPPTQRRATGTGFLVSPRTVVTAGHCLWSFGFPGPPRPAEFIRAVPANNKPGPPSAFLDVADPSILVPPAWRTLSVAGVPNWESDYGAFHLPAPISDKLMQPAALNDAQLWGLPAAIVGYPNDDTADPPKPFGTMWGQIGKVDRAVGSFVYYDIDTSPSQSGSPVYTIHKGIAYVIAIHEAGQEQMNRGIRITSAVLADIDNWISRTDWREG